jgi:hypothetical protein
MEDPTNEEASKGTTRKQSSRAAKKLKRKSAPARSDDGSPSQLMRRGRTFVRKAEKWAGGAARLASPLADAGANAMVIGMLGLGLGIALGAMLPRMSMSNMVPSSVMVRSKKRNKSK